MRRIGGEIFPDTLSEYQCARDAVRLAPRTLDELVRPVLESCEYHGTMPWQLLSREVDRYVAGVGKRAASPRKPPCPPHQRRPPRAHRCAAPLMP
ncbi:recombinase (plasmid) [Streptomyces clavuligerus]|uniref:Putative recombinase n=1 Tax=Streptomyces clavuligerus TaxID=1901 RepID=B5GRW2_STRCL|nr:hypothetical protein SSCG_02086 [Streptomyces clavuligerus]EFG03758.1 putative recombinase [Streptomyces clavuligerus]QCS09745.1 recombinase [Streptomyces clavuligerus]QPJ98210.1 recombinase [Streptomyces clavuligerus]